MRALRFFKTLLFIHQLVGASHKLVYIFNTAYRAVRASDAYRYLIRLSRTAVEFIDLCLYFAYEP